MYRRQFKHHLWAGYKIYLRKFPHLKLAITAVAVVFSLFVLFVLRVLAHELPQPWVEKLEDELSTDAFYVELNGVSLSLIRGLRLNHVAVYPKRVAHKPIATALMVHFDLDIFARGSLLNRVKAISIDKFELSLHDLTVEAEESKEESILPQIGPVDIYCREAHIFGLDAREIETEIAIKGSTISCNGIELALTDSNDANPQHATGFVSYDVIKNKLDFYGDGKLKVESLLPMFDNLELYELNRELEKIEFPGLSPMVNAHIRYSPNESVYSLDLHVDAGHTLYNGVDFNSVMLYLKAHGTNGWSNVDINSLVGRRPEGPLSGSLLIDIDNDLLYFNATSHIRPSHLLTSIGILDNEEQFPLEVELPCLMRANGTVGISDATASALKLDGTVEAHSISYNGTMFENASAKVSMKYDSWDVEEIEAQLYKGPLDGKIVFTPKYVPNEGLSIENVNFAADFNVENASLDVAVRSCNLSSSDIGSIHGYVNLNGYVNFDISGGEDDLKTMVGAMKLDVLDANIYRIPLFAGFTDILLNNVSGLDFMLTQNSLKAELDIRDECAYINTIDIVGPALSLTGDGTLSFDGIMDAKIMVSLLNHETWVGKGLQLLLFPLSKIFELRAIGPLENLTWTSSNLGGGRDTLID